MAENIPGTQVERVLWERRLWQEAQTMDEEELSLWIENTQEELAVWIRWLYGFRS